MRFPYMICPARDLGTNVFSQVSCRPNPVFVWRSFEFTGPARRILQTVVTAFHYDYCYHSDPQLSVRSKSSVDTLCAIPATRTRHGDIRLVGRALWWLFRVRLQAGFQHQGLRTLDPWSWRYDRPNGLPVSIVLSSQISIWLSD